MDANGLPLLNYLLQHTLRSLCTDSQWIYAVFWRILPRNYPPPKWDSEGGIMDRSRGNKRNWILVWEDAYFDFPRCGRVSCHGFGGDSVVAHVSHNQKTKETFQPELFFKMSHDVYNYGEGLMGKVAADNSHKWVHKEPSENDVSFLSSWHGAIDPHPKTWEAQFKSGIETIAVVAVREGLIQLGSLHKVTEDLNFVIFLQRKFNYLQSIPGVFAMHPTPHTVGLDPRKQGRMMPARNESPHTNNIQEACGGGGGGATQYQHYPVLQYGPTTNNNNKRAVSSSMEEARPRGPLMFPPSINNAEWCGYSRGTNYNMNINPVEPSLPLMRPSMSSLQALLSKLPSVTTCAEQSHHHQALLSKLPSVTTCAEQSHHHHLNASSSQNDSHDMLHMSSLTLDSNPTNTTPTPTPAPTPANANLLFLPSNNANSMDINDKETALPQSSS